MAKKELIIPVSQLTKTIESLRLNSKKVALVGGHYILLYERKSDSLKPAIYQEFEEWGNMAFSKAMAKNFPVKSFELTAKLFYYFRLCKIESKCVLLVNDDSFLRKDFRNEVHYESIKDRGAELRQQYFNLEDNIPISYRKILVEFRIRMVDFFARFPIQKTENGRQKESETIFVSERKLCKSFKKTVRHSVKKDQLFKITNIDESGNDNIDELTVESGKVRTVCLIEKGVCNCGGKAFQFYLDLIQMEFDTIIFFVPDECTEHVKEGAELIINSPRIEGRNISIINIMNLENNTDLHDESDDLILNHYTNYSNIAVIRT